MLSVQIGKHDRTLKAWETISRIKDNKGQKVRIYEFDYTSILCCFFILMLWTTKISQGSVWPFQTKKLSAGTLKI